MGGDPNRRHEEEPETKPKVQADADPGAHARYKGGRVSADQAQQVIATGTAAQRDMSPGISAPPSLDLGEGAVGTPNTESFMLFNNGATDAYVRVELEGSTAFQLVQKPELLFPSRQGIDPSSAVRIRFAPTRKGRTEGTLVVHARWANGDHAPQELRIPVTGAAHEAGQPSLGEEEADAKQKADRQRAQNDHAAAVSAAEKAEDAQIDSGRRPGNAASQGYLDAATQTARTNLNLLLINRIAGVTTAQHEVEKFKRAKPAYHESLLERLAWTALDIATGNIASKLGKRVEQALTSSFKVAAHLGPNGEPVAESTSSPSAAVVAIFSDSVRDVTKRSAKAGVDAIKPAHDDGGGIDGAAVSPSANKTEGKFASNDPIAAFFGHQTLSLTGDTLGRATEITREAKSSLEPLLDSKPHEAVHAMEAIAREIGEAATSSEAQDTQAQASAMQWMTYLAQSSLGTVTADEAKQKGMRTPADESPTTRLDAANVAPTTHGAPRSVDGLVNVAFTADITNAAKPVSIGHVKVTGVGKDVAHRLASASLREAGLPIRAYGAPSANNAVLPLTAMRDEAGNVQYTDETGAPGSPGNWFARKIGEPNGGPDAQLRGARALLEHEILALTPAQKDIETDDANDKK